jgi:xanthine dehydrogenase YagS FAD-binding subunit
MMQPFDYLRPETTADALRLLDRETRPLAGGTDLLPLMKEELFAPARLIDIKRLADLDGEIRQDVDSLAIGALTPLAEIEESGLIQAHAPALAEAAGLAASPQIRNMATIGGNLLQRPRCWYFRDHEVPCWLKGGNDCPAATGENRSHAIFDESVCQAVHPSDLATALVSLDAAVELRGPGGDRTVPIEHFFSPPTDDRRRETTLEPDELVRGVRIPVRSGDRGVYLKAMERKAWAFALVGIAVRLELDGNEIRDARVALGGVAPVPHRAHDAESVLTGNSPGREIFERAAEAALAGARPLAHNAYKIPLAKTLIIRALETATSPS